MAGWRAMRQGAYRPNSAGTALEHSLNQSLHEPALLVIAQVVAYHRLAHTRLVPCTRAAAGQQQAWLQYSGGGGGSRGGAVAAVSGAVAAAAGLRRWVSEGRG